MTLPAASATCDLLASQIATLRSQLDKALADDTAEKSEITRLQAEVARLAAELAAALARIAQLTAPPAPPAPPAPLASVSIFTTQVPAESKTDGSSYELGTRFTVSAATLARSIRFHKAAGETGSHVGRIWNATTKALIASVTFTDETASGWQTKALASPLQLVAGASYIVSVNINRTFSNTGAFFNAAITNGVLSAGIGAGVYSLAPTLCPDRAANNASYFVDIAVDAVAGTPPPIAASVVTVACSPATALEDGTANLVYTFTRTGSTSSEMSANYTVGGTATNGSDYTGISTTGTTKTVTFAAGSATAVVTVDPTADTTAELDETVALTLATGSGYTIGTTGAVTGTITNDDGAPPPPPSPSGLMGWQLNATNVGLAPHGIVGSSLPVYSGPQKIPAGSRISGVRFVNNIDLSFGNIIIEKSIFQPIEAGAGMPISTTVDFNAFIPVPSKVIIRDCEFDGSLLKSDRPEFTDQRMRSSVSGFEGIADLQRNYIHDLGTGIVLRYTGTQLDSLVENNYVDNLAAWGDAGTNGSHNNGLAIRDFSDADRPSRRAIIRNNRFELDTPNNASSCIQISSFNGPTNNVTLEGNLLEGYGYNLYLSKGYLSVGNNMVCTNNRIDPWSGWPTFSDPPGWSVWQEIYRYDAKRPDAKGAPIPQF